MAVKYTLELFPTEGNWDSYVQWFGSTEVERDNENAGVDVYCVKKEYATNRSVTFLDLGVKARMLKHSADDSTETCHFWLAPRSSIWKSGVRQANSMGVIDRSYRGVLMGAVISNHVGVCADTVQIEAGTRLFQVLAPDMGWISKVVLKPLSELNETSRGEGGFGSTGK
jgi:dUTPase